MNPLPITLAYAALGLSCTLTTVALRRRGERYVSTAALLYALWAAVGVAEHGTGLDLADLHRFAGSLATCTGLPLVAVQYTSTCVGWPGREGRLNVMGMGVVGFAAFGLAFPIELYPRLIAWLTAVVVMTTVGVGAQSRTRRLAALLGALGIAVVGRADEALSSQGVALRCGVLAVAIALLGMGLERRAP